MSLIVDNYGCLIQLERGSIGKDAQFDGGDSICWTGHHKYYSEIAVEDLHNYMPFTYYFRRFGKTFGYVRHPSIGRESSHYYKHPWAANMSHEQLIGLILYLHKFPSFKETMRIFVHLMCWGFLFSHNTVKNNDTELKFKWPDVLFLDFYSVYLRLFGWFTYPITSIIDVWLVVLVLWFNAFKKDEHVITFGAKIISCRALKPTLFSWLAFKILNKEKFLKLNYRYWCGFRKQSTMYELTKKRIYKLMGDK